MRYHFGIAWRYILSRRFGSFGGLILAVSIFGIAVAIFSLVIIMSVMNGFGDELKTRLLGFDPHITLTMVKDDAKEMSLDDISEWISSKDVEIISPYAEGEIIALSTTTGESIVHGARLRGISREDGKILEKLGAITIDPAEASEKTVVIGNELAMQLSVYPGFGDTIKIIAPLADIGPTGETVPGVSQFEVSGLFRTGIYNWDSKYILADIDSAISLLGLQARKGFLIWLVSPGDVNRCKTILTKNLPEGWNVQSWNDKNERLFSALKLERIAMSAILVMALLISSFSISVIVLMLVSSKKKDIAIMRSVGMQDRDIKKIFLVCAGMIGAAGSTLGTILGLAVCIVLKFSPPVLPASYYLDFLPVRISFPATAAFWLTGVAVAVIAAIYPVRKTGTTDVVEALRYE